MIKRLLAVTAVILCAFSAHAQTVQPLIQPQQHFVDGSGNPCAGCSLFSYIAGTTTPQPTYTSSPGLVQNTNPVVLDATGAAQIWMGSTAYKFVLIDTSGTTLWTVDNVIAPFPGATSNLIFPSINNVCYANAQTGTDFSAKVNACISGLPASGGIVDATGLVGSQAASSANISLPTRTVLKLGCGVTISGTSQVTLASYSAIQGCGAAGVYADESNFNANAATIWQYTASSGNFITVSPGSFGVKLSDFRAIGKYAISGGSGSGNGLFVSPGTGPNSTVGVTLDNVDFQGFYGDGYHLEDNVQFVKCYGCSASQNNGYCWNQVTNATTIAPGQVDLFSPRMNSCGSGEIYVGGGASAGEIHIFGGTVANDLAPQNNNNNQCILFQGNGSQQVRASIYGTHLEGCGKTSGTTSFVDWDVQIGTLTLEAANFSNASGMTAYPVYLSANFGSSAYIGPNLYSVPSAPNIIFNANASSSGTVRISDELGPSGIGGTVVSGMYFVNGQVPRNTVVGGGDWLRIPSAWGIRFDAGFNWSTSGSNLFLSDSGAVNLVEFQQSPNPSTFFQPVIHSGTVAFNSTSAFNGVSTFASGSAPIFNDIASFNAIPMFHATPNFGAHFVQGAGNVIGGACTMAAGTCTGQSFSAAYNSAPACTCSWTGTGTLTGILKCAATTSTITPASTINTDTAVVAWHCDGNPN